MAWSCSPVSACWAASTPSWGKLHASKNKKGWSCGFPHKTTQPGKVCSLICSLRRELCVYIKKGQGSEKRLLKPPWDAGWKWGGLQPSPGTFRQAMRPCNLCLMTRPHWGKAPQSSWCGCHQWAAARSVLWDLQDVGHALALLKAVQATETTAEPGLLSWAHGGSKLWGAAARLQQAGCTHSSPSALSRCAAGSAAFV